MSHRPESRTRPCNVLVIGTGGAGLRAAIAARQAGVDVLVIGKRSRLDAHTVLAAGGLNAALGTVDPQDSWQQHFADTMREGYSLSDPRADSQCFGALAFDLHTGDRTVFAADAVILCGGGCKDGAIAGVEIERERAEALAVGGEQA